VNAIGSPQRFMPSWPQRILSAVLTAFVGIVVAGACADSAADAVGTIVGLGLGAVLAARCLRLGVTINDQHVVVRNVFRTRAVPIGDADRFEFVTLWWAIKGPDEAVGLITTDKRKVPITGLALPSISRLQRKVQEQCVAMNRELRRRKRTPTRSA
jgi:hypothetical protein